MARARTEKLHYWHRSQLTPTRPTLAVSDTAFWRFGQRRERYGHPDMLVLTRTEVEELLDLDNLVDALAAAHAELSADSAKLVPRVGVWSGSGVLGAMPGYAPSAGMGCKLVTLFEGNRDRPTHQALIALVDPANGTPTALMDGTYITAMRTAAAAALATKLLSRPDSSVLAVL